MDQRFLHIDILLQSKNHVVAANGAVEIRDGQFGYKNIAN